MSDLLEIIMPSFEVPALRQVLKAPNIQKIADALAVSWSSLCAVHCLVAPAALIFVPIFGASILDDESFHEAILWLILPTSLVALLLGCWRHKDRYVALLCVTGLAAIAIGARFGQDSFGESGEKVITFAGSFLLITGHFRNFVLCRSTACDQ